MIDAIEITSTPGYVLVLSLGLFISCYFSRLPNSMSIILSLLMFPVAHAVDSKDMSARSTLAFLAIQSLLKVLDMINDRQFYEGLNTPIRFLHLFLTVWPVHCKIDSQRRFDFQLFLSMIRCVTMSVLCFNLMDGEIFSAYCQSEKILPKVTSDSNATTLNYFNYFNDFISQINFAINGNEGFEEYHALLQHYRILSMQCLLVGGFTYFSICSHSFIIRFLMVSFSDFDLPPMMSSPHMSKSLREYWGVRWNKPINYELKALIYKPLVSRRFNPSFALLLTFLASGVYHAYPTLMGINRNFPESATFFSVITCLYFLSQGIFMVFQDFAFGSYKTICGKPAPQILRWSSTVFFAALPAPCFSLPVLTLFFKEKADETSFFSATFWALHALLVLEFILVLYVYHTIVNSVFGKETNVISQNEALIAKEQFTLNVAPAAVATLTTDDEVTTSNEEEGRKEKIL